MEDRPEVVRCSKCGLIASIDDFVCRACGGPLEITTKSGISYPKTYAYRPGYLTQTGVILGFVIVVVPTAALAFLTTLQGSNVTPVQVAVAFAVLLVIATSTFLYLRWDTSSLAITLREDGIQWTMRDGRVVDCLNTQLRIRGVKNGFILSRDGADARNVSDNVTDSLELRQELKLRSGSDAL